MLVSKLLRRFCGLLRCRLRLLDPPSRLRRFPCSLRPFEQLLDRLSREELEASKGHIAQLVADIIQETDHSAVGLRRCDNPRVTRERPEELLGALCARAVESLVHFQPALAQQEIELPIPSLRPPLESSGHPVVDLRAGLCFVSAELIAQVIGKVNERSAQVGLGCVDDGLHTGLELGPRRLTRPHLLRSGPQVIHDGRRLLEHRRANSGEIPSAGGAT